MPQVLEFTNRDFADLTDDPPIELDLIPLDGGDLLTDSPVEVSQSDPGNRPGQFTCTLPTTVPYSPGAWYEGQILIDGKFAGREEFFIDAEDGTFRASTRASAQVLDSVPREGRTSRWTNTTTSATEVVEISEP